MAKRIPTTVGGALRRVGGKSLAAAAVLLGLSAASALPASAQDLSSFAILAGSTITNIGITTITGNVGLSPGSSITGDNDGADTFVLDGTIHIADGVAVNAKNQLTTAFNALMGRTSLALTGDLGNRTLTAGVYSYGSSALLTGPLTLSGGPDSIFVIQVGSSLTVANNASIVLQGGVQARNVFFVVGESVTLGTDVLFQGQIMAGTSITINHLTTIACGAAYAQTGAVTMNTNTIGICTFVFTPGDIADLLGDGITKNGKAITDAIDDYVQGGGELPLGFQVLALLSPTELAAALEQISGETGTGSAPAATQAMDSFLDLLGHGGPGVLTSRGGDQPLEGGTVSVMGYADMAPPSRGGAFDGFDQPRPALEPAPWTVWSSAFGGRSVTNGDGELGTHDLTATDYGVAIGFERQVSTDTMFGFAISGGGTNFDLADSLGSGESAMLQAAVYARTNYQDAYFAGALALGYHQVSTDRYLTFAGLDHFSADFSAMDMAGEIEAGYHVGWFTPFAKLRAQSYTSPAYSEVTESGASTFALDYDARTVMTLRTEIGARADWTADIGEDGTLTLFASAAWAHDYWSDDGMGVAFQELPGSHFTIEGATPAADSLVASAGAELSLGSGVSLGGSVNGKLSSNAVDYGATARLGYSW